VNRLLAIGTTTTLASALTADLLLFAAGMGATAVCMVRRLWWCVAVEIAGAALIRRFPDQANVVFVTTCCVVLIASAWILAHARRPSPTT
jgi:hypothetical protein